MFAACYILLRYLLRLCDPDVYLHIHIQKSFILKVLLSGYLFYYGIEILSCIRVRTLIRGDLKADWPAAVAKFKTNYM